MPLQQLINLGVVCPARLKFSLGPLTE